jgi:hypothetical protein
MKALFFIGLIVLILGFASLVVPLPRNEKHGFKAGPVSASVESKREETVEPIVSAAMIVGGAALMIFGKVK